MDSAHNASLKSSNALEQWALAVSFRTLGVAVALVLLLISPTASAEYGTVRRVFLGSAYTLEQGKLAVGVFSPLQYGLLDELMFSTHPVLDLLLTPNLSLKGKVYDGPVAISFSASYVQTFLKSAKSTFPGMVSAFPMMTVPIGESASLSAQCGYILDVSPLSHGVMIGGNATFLIGASDMIQVSVQALWYAKGRGFQVPTGVLSYGHAWYRMRVTVGIAAGQFPLHVGSGGAKVVNLPVYPVLDLWWQL
jgi:hypothetical protein